ncbi:MAG: hypothetical protein K6G03_11250 [Lachnospiraceae bacterium]|nr:hypothetical protein [Lachnospiraceae bacterium]
MHLPEDWDKPDKGNDILCRRFKHGVWTGHYTDHNNDTDQLNYRYFIPEITTEGNEGTLPLALYLHGADAFGDDNDSQLSIHDIGTMFVRDEWQAIHPCCVIAPQCSRGRHWSNQDVLRLLHMSLNTFIDEHPVIDISRIYVYGYSAGGLGVLNLIKSYPGYYAGAISICGATGADRSELLLKTPLWMVHAIDDNIVKATYKHRFFENDTSHYGYYMGSKDLYERLKKLWPFDDDRINYTEYPEGFMKENFNINPHCSWVTVSDQKSGIEFREWLFRQKRT